MLRPALCVLCPVLFRPVDELPAAGGTERQCTGGQGRQRAAELVRRRHRHRGPREDHPRTQRSAKSLAGAAKYMDFVVEPGSATAGVSFF